MIIEGSEEDSASLASFATPEHPDGVTESVGGSKEKLGGAVAWGVDTFDSRAEVEKKFGTVDAETLSVALALGSSAA